MIQKPGHFQGSIFSCPTSAALPPERDPMIYAIFNCQMNNKGNSGLPSNIACWTNFSATMILHPSAFVVFADTRTHSGETPFYGSGPTKNLGDSHGTASQLSSRHNAKMNFVFADGQVAYFKYIYAC
jgi:prepilin-type processing-associated H-X9-DG protein